MSDVRELVDELLFTLKSWVTHVPIDDRAATTDIMTKAVAYLASTPATEARPDVEGARTEVIEAARLACSEPIPGETKMDAAKEVIRRIHAIKGPLLRLNAAEREAQG